MTDTRQVSVPALGPGFWAKLVGLGSLDALVLYVLTQLAADGMWSAVVVIGLVTLFVNWVYLSSRPEALGLRWIAPGLVFFIGLTIVPVLYNAYIAFTNYSIQHFLPKEQAIESLEQRFFLPENPESFDAFVYRSDSGEFRILLRTRDGELLLGVPRDADDPPLDQPIEDLSAYETVDEDGDGIPERIGPFRRLLLRDLIPLESEVTDLRVDLPGRGVAQLVTFTTAGLREPVFEYDPERDALIDRELGEVCPADDTIGAFVCPSRGTLTPGWPVPVGFDNFRRVVQDVRVREPFLRVLGWNFAYAIGIVVLTFAFGMLLAMVLHDERLRGKRFYRSIYILPYVIPALISSVIWRGLFNTQFGAVNRVLDPLVELFRDDPIPWLQSGFWAKVAIFILTLWLGFPYMFLITTGALQAIPAELQEAARVDGASGWQVFWRVTFPLLMVSIAPLLIGSFAYNFNNFFPIFFLTNGGPPLPGYAVPVGETDILITFTFNLAVNSGRGGQYALAAAISFFIFFIVAIVSAFSFRFTKRLEETYGNL